MKTLGILAVLIIIIGGIFLWSRGGEQVPTELPEVNTDTQNNTGDVAGEQVSVAPSDAEIAWTGSKTLIANYEDNGVVDLKEGYLIESDGAVVGGRFVVDMETIAAVSTGRGDGEDMLSNHLKSDDFFNVALYPESMLVIANVEERSDLVAENSTHLVTGDLTIKDVTNTISFPANIIRNENGQWEVNTRFDIDRTEWGIQYGSGSFFDNLGDNVIDDMITFSVRLVSESTLEAESTN